MTIRFSFAQEDALGAVDCGVLDENMYSGVSPLRHGQSSLILRRQAVTEPFGYKERTASGVLFGEGACTALRRNANTTLDQAPRRRGCLSFSNPPVSEVHFRPYTHEKDRRALFYSRDEIAVFRARRHENDVSVTLSDGVGVREVPCLYGEAKFKARLFHNEDELTG